MKLSSLTTFLFFWSSAFCLPVSSATSVPQEAIVGFLDLSEDDDIMVLRASNGTCSGLLFLNSTVLHNAQHNESSQLHRRDANAWHWLRLDKGEPLYKRAAEPWHWLRLDKGEPLY